MLCYNIIGVVDNIKKSFQICAEIWITICIFLK